MPTLPARPPAVPAFTGYPPGALSAAFSSALSTTSSAILPTVLSVTVAAFAAASAWGADDESEKQLTEMRVSQVRSAVTTANPSPQAEVTAEEIRAMNVVNVEDSLKYLPSLQIRKRYVGDRNGIIASRSAGTLASARSLVYADGLLLSNLLGSGFGYPPRWNLVGSDEIDTTTVLYGPFSALLPGNSAGATILMTTRRPRDFEAHARVQAFSEKFALYGSRGTFDGHQEQATLGGSAGNWSWSVLGNHLDSYGHPMSFATANASGINAGGGDTVVSGYRTDRDASNRLRYIWGAYGMDHTIQDVGKVRIAYDFSPHTRAAFTFAEWRNDSSSRAESYLRDAAGNVVDRGTINVDGKRYTLAAANFAPTASNTTNRLYGFTLHSRLSPDWRLEAAASSYTTPTDISRSASNATAANGTVTLADGTGWQNLDLRGIWAPGQGKAGHTVSLGYHLDEYTLKSGTYSATDWRNEESRTTLAGRSAGKTRTQALYLQDDWKFLPGWTLTPGWRHERWQAFDGRIFTTALGDNNYESREKTTNSPKLALAWQVLPDWLLRASLGRAYRFPTVSELFQTEKVGNVTRISDPNLRPEKILAKDLTAEGAVLGGLLRLSLFEDQVEDYLYSQTDLATNTTRVENIGKTRARGVETAWQAQDVGINGLNLTGSLTYVESRILNNPGDPATVGKRIPRVPDWRASLFASYRLDEHWTTSLGVKYSGLQYGTLNNSDPNGDVYGGVGKFTTLDARLGYRFGKRVAAAIGVDNLTNEKYYVAHPMPQRTWHAELRIDY